MSAYEWKQAPAADFAVIGDPVAHSRSPQMHQAAYAALGLPFQYVRVHVPPGEVVAALNHLHGLGYQGVNVTIPHKEEVIGWCRDIDPLGQWVKAINTIRMRDRIGINTDAPGFLETLRDRGIEPGRALVLGAGGSARALVYALEEEGWQVRLCNRTKSRAVAMVRDLKLQAEVIERPDPTDCDLILNTTSASLQGKTLPMDWSKAKPGTWAYDLAYGEGPTPFLLHAGIEGFRVVDGRPLLVAQGALSLEWWLGIPAPRVAMSEAIR